MCVSHCKNEICKLMQTEAGVRKNVELALADLEEVCIYIHQHAHGQ